MVRARRGSGKRVIEAALTGGSEDGAGTAGMLPIVARFGAGSWTRRQGVRQGSTSLKEGKWGGRERGGGRHLLKRRQGEAREGW
jgi:hypothetical protein